MEQQTIKHWYALYTKSRAEKKVLEKLTQAGIEAYLPLKRELKQWSDRKKWVKTPAISSYIFIKIPKSEYHTLFNIQGVVSYVCYKGKAVVIPDREIEIMQKAVENRLSFNIEPGKIEKGENVTVTSGPLKGISGKVTAISGTKKLHIEIGNIGYTLVVNLDNDVNIEKGK
ncbi:UpxY family transcription antiterminator [Marinilabiliaceae bacterium ANBcel2]|nr:UpxY family transcription antiterminator [Marinilabiliaceae bacterium ANBcel2]